MLTSDVDIAQTAEAAELFLSDGVIVTGTTTGSPVDAEDVKGQLTTAVYRPSHTQRSNRYT